MTSTVSYENHLRTSCTHLSSASSFETDAPVDNNGKGERFSPTDLLATSLAACMLTVMGIKCKSMNQDLDSLKIEVDKVMMAEPRRVGGINLTVHIPEHLAFADDKTKQILKTTAATCPVMKSIHPDIIVNIDWGKWS
ncbi:MAG TPA: OsmC family protein [Flavisolibacter sp.]|jgi:uncharacterized OsmC-like protein|nr:OsmC family protein [Flavisolibacter sp.]